MSPSKKASPGSGASSDASRALQGHLAHVGAGEERAPDVDRVRRRGHQRGVPRADEHPHEVREALLGADGRHHLGLGVELDGELAPVEVGDRAAQLGDAPRGGVAVVARVVGGLGELVHRHVGRGQVGVPEAEVDDVTAGSPRRRLQVVDRGEDVGRQPVDPAELHRWKSTTRPTPPRTPGPRRRRARRPPAARRRPAIRTRPNWRRRRAAPRPSPAGSATRWAAGRPRSPRSDRVPRPARATNAGSASHTVSAAPTARASSVRPAVPPATQTASPAPTSARPSSTSSARRSAAGAKGIP